jgi:hypothetical protein
LQILVIFEPWIRIHIRIHLKYWIRYRIQIRFEANADPQHWLALLLCPPPPPPVLRPLSRLCFLGGGKVAGTAPGPGGQVPGEEEVPAAEDHLGRRAEDPLLQGADQEPPQGVVPPR